MAFKYASDVGVDSIAGIKKAESLSNIPHSVTSTYRPGSITLSGNLSYHARKNAVDSSSSPANMRALAQWIIDHFAPYTLELIHSTGKGYFVHNGKIVGASAYGAAIVNQHYDHVHWAITNSGLKAGGLDVSTGTIINAVLPSTNAVAYDQSTNNGCSFTVLIVGSGLVTGVVTLGGVLAHLLG